MPAAAAACAATSTDEDSTSAVLTLTEAVRDWASKKLVFAHDQCLFVADVRAHFERDTGLSGRDVGGFVKGIEAAARSQGIREDIRGLSNGVKGGQKKGRIYRCRWVVGHEPTDGKAESRATEASPGSTVENMEAKKENVDAERMPGSENEQDDDDDEEQSMEERIETVREWASKKLVFTNDDYMFASDVREYFERDSGASIPNRTSFFRGIEAAA
eukprot:SAG31_NODE_7908_length_1567_cov_10.321526_1_plen_215_part_01